MKQCQKYPAGFVEFSKKRSEGPALNIESAVSVTCDAVAGNVKAGGDVNCDTVCGFLRPLGAVSLQNRKGRCQRSYGLPSSPLGFSHGLKTVPRTVFLTAFRIP